MKTKLLLTIITISIASSLYSQSKIESGLLISGGSGAIFGGKSQLTTYKEETKYKVNLTVGYRFRLSSISLFPFFFDVDANVGIRSWSSEYKLINGYLKGYGMSFDNTNSITPTTLSYSFSSQYYYASAGGTINYPLTKYFNVGVGVEPTYTFFQQGDRSKNKYFLPSVLKIGYNLKFMEIGAVYKYGLLGSINTNFLSMANFSDWQISIWIPF